MAFFPPLPISLTGLDLERGGAAAPPSLTAANANLPSTGQNNNDNNTHPLEEEERKAALRIADDVAARIIVVDSIPIQFNAAARGSGRRVAAAATRAKDFGSLALWLFRFSADESGRQTDDRPRRSILK